jgi:hypothetical protein
MRRNPNVTRKKAEEKQNSQKLAETAVEEKDEFKGIFLPGKLSYQVR